jgi:DNA-binding NarL/FixJ family response regulator
MIRVRIKAVSAVTRAGLESLLREYPQFRIMDEATEEADSEADAQADVVLAEDQGTAETRHLVEDASEHTPVIMLVHGSAAEHLNAFRNGARAVLPSHAAGPQIAAAIEAVAAGLGVFDASEAEGFLPAVAVEPAAAQLPEELTPREVEVLRAMAEGLANKEIAPRLGISENTVKFHVASVLGKLGAASRTEAVMMGIRHGIVLI